jgi:phenylpropionate dioxygenase-like ring-hydroxylating dioxygenase large terminal subunit
VYPRRQGAAISPSGQPHRFIWSGTALGLARSLPERYYTSPDVFAEEVRHIHLKHWFFVGREDELRGPGAWRAIETVGGPVLLARDAEGVLRAFANFCRHRGSILAQGCGVAEKLVCPYHAWSFRLDGTLAGAPAMAEVPGFRREDNGLLPVRMECWAGNIFLNFDADAPDLMTHLGDLPERFASHAVSDMVCTWRTEIETRCNWKLLLENAMETYHTGIVHAATVGAQSSVTFPTRGEWLCIQVQSDSSIAVLDRTGPAPFEPIPGLDADGRRGTYFTLIHPTTQFAASQDCLWWLAVRPLACDRSLLSLGGCFPRSRLALPDFAERAAPYYDRWERVAMEDVGILERQQIALGSHLHDPGLLSWRDDMVHAINDWIVARLAPRTTSGRPAP